MPLLKSKKQPLGDSAWFTTHKIEEGPSLMPVGASDPAEAILMVAMMAVWALIVSIARYALRSGRISEGWGTYRGIVYCQIYNDDLRFFTTIRGTSRIVLKPPVIARPLSTLTNFRTYMSDTPRVSFAFSDGFQVELYSSNTEGELTKFREVVNSRLGPVADQ